MSNLKQKSALPANRAFVIRLAADAVVERADVSGRVEHVVSGQGTHFSSWEELRSFIVRTLGPQEARGETASRHTNQEHEEEL